MIVAAGLSPAWQQVLTVDRFEAGEVNRAREAIWCASGKVLNVGLALHFLAQGRREETFTISPLGGLAYDAIDREFELLGMQRQWIRTQSPTRICTTIVDGTGKSATELVENAGPITLKELHEFRDAFVEAASKSSAIVLTGSLPKGVPSSLFAELLERVSCPAVLDIRGAELLAALEARPMLVKPNRDELGQTVGRPLVDDSDVEEAIDELHRRGAQSVLVTSGADSAWLSANGAVQRMAPEPVGDIVNPIGCGDCLAAGVAWTLGHGGDVVSAVEHGMSLAAKNLATLLPSDFDGRRRLAAQDASRRTIAL